MQLGRQWLGEQELVGGEKGRQRGKERGGRAARGVGGNGDGLVWRGFLHFVRLSGVCNYILLFFRFFYLGFFFIY